MSTTTVVLAPAHHVASLIANLVLHSELPAPILEEVRELLQTYPPRRIAHALDEALSLSIIDGKAPVWPPTGEINALRLLMLELLDLADLLRTIPSPYVLAA